MGGYGYKFSRLVVFYVLTLLVFTVFYQVDYPASLGVHLGSTSPDFVSAFITSLSSFHGRPFFYIGGYPSGTVVTNLTDYIALGEAMIGLVLEGMAIAMLAQRFTGKSGS